MTVRGGSIPMWGLTGTIVSVMVFILLILLVACCATD